ncbi:DUF7002 family protein [Novipirellula sp. SH528]|uniref:DUF7002 family protein n=1 Tax=Novipirellula sp. SH528 TaxID=3454466 RepID=UPI003F9F5B08
MTEDEFIAIHPCLYHIAEGGSWPSVQQHGLESTSAILDRFEVTGPRRVAIESARRATSERLEHEQHESVVIRDQKPISETKLATALEGMTTAEWYTMLNGYVFLWPSVDRRNGMLSSYGDQNHDVLTIDTQRLLDVYGGQLMLSPINSGNTLYDAAPRGADTFVQLAQCPFDDWRKRKKKKAEEVIAEATLPYRLENVEQFTICVEAFSGSRFTGAIWKPAA